MVGVHLDSVEQTSLLHSLLHPKMASLRGSTFVGEFKQKVWEKNIQEWRELGADFIDSAVLYGMVRARISKGRLPSKIIAFGQTKIGIAITKYAFDMSEAEMPAPVIDPHPADVAQGQVQSGDLILVNSSHVMNPTTHFYSIYFELLPALPAGVLVQINQICGNNSSNIHRPQQRH